MLRSRRSLLINLTALALGAVVAWKVGQGIAKGPALPQEWVYVTLAAASSVMIFRDPIWGLYLFPVALFVIPTNTHLAGIRFLSPPLMIGAVTLVVGFAHRVVKGKRLPLSKVVLIVILLIGWHLFYFLINYGEDAGLRLYNFAQGSITLFLAWLVIDTREQATRVMYAWIFAWLGRSILSITRFLNRASFAPTAWPMLPRITDAQIGANTNEMAWIGLLFIPVILEVALAERGLRMRMAWFATLLIVVLGTLVTYSRSGVLGIFLSIVVLLLLEGKPTRGLFRYIIVAMVCIMTVWLFISTFPAFSVRLEAVQDAVLERMAWWQGGVRLSRTSPLMGVGPDDLANPGTHSYVAKSAMEFGVLYVLLFATLFGLMLRNNWQLLRGDLDPTTRAVSMGIAVSTLVAIAESFFGITFQSSAYAMVFWVFQGVQMAYWNSIRRQTPEHSGGFPSARKAM